MYGFLSGTGKRRLLLLAGILLIGLGVRIVVSLTAYASTFDTATVGLMGLRILQGEHYLFFEGQSYMGSLEAYLAALLFAVFGPGEFTLTLSPILFSLGWIAATFLLFDELLGLAAGVGAALTLSVPTWVTLWYCVGSYGGYPGSLFFGTATLWLSVCVGSRNWRGWALWLSAFFIGLFSGLAVWTDFLACVHVGLAWLIIAGWLAKERRHPKLLVPFAGMIIGAIVGAAPLLLNWREVLGQHAVGCNISLPVVLSRLRGLAERPLLENIFWHFDAHRILGCMTIGLLCAAVTVCIWAFSSSSPDLRIRLSLPVVFCGLFLVFYLSHPLASARAPRHVLPLWTMFVASVFSIPLASQRVVIRNVAWALLSVWLALVAGQDALATIENYPKRAASMSTRMALAKTAEDLSLRNVEMIGGMIFGHEGQMFSFAAKGRINFVSTFDERHQPSAQAAEADASVAFVCRKRHLQAIRKTLEDLGADYQVKEVGSLSLLYSIVTKPLPRSLIPVTNLSVSLMGHATGRPNSVFDRKSDSVICGRFGEDEGMVVDLKEERLLNSIYLIGPDMSDKGLPEDVRVDVLGGDGDWQTVREPGRRIPNAHVSGNRVYMEGYNPVMEIRFVPVRTSRLRLTFLAGGSRQEKWAVDEMCIFEERGEDVEPLGEAEVSALAEDFKKRGCSFAVCDGWISAVLLNRLPWQEGRPPVFPRFNPKHGETLLPRRFVPSPGMAFILPLELASNAEEVLHRLYGSSLRWKRVDYQHYAFIAVIGVDCDVPQRRLRWNGVLLREATQDSEG